MFFGPLDSQPWESVRHWTAEAHGVSPAAAGVLTVAGSLTRFLERHHRMRMDVQLHDQIVDSTAPDEARILDCPIASPALRRNVSLLHRGTVMFDAESVLPLETLPTELMHALQEGKRPLANLLIDHGLSLSRSDLNVACIESAGRFAGYWARRSLLRSDAGTRALVVEVFRPEIWKRIDSVAGRWRA